jgi:hypothetical protein
MVDAQEILDLDLAEEKAGEGENVQRDKKLLCETRRNVSGSLTLWRCGVHVRWRRRS